MGEPGIVGVQRSKVAEAQIVLLPDGGLAPAGQDHIEFRYLAIYELEADDPRIVLDEVRARANTAAMVISPLLTNVYTALYRNF